MDCGEIHAKKRAVHQLGEKAPSGENVSLKAMTAIMQCIYFHNSLLFRLRIYFRQFIEVLLFYPEASSVYIKNVKQVSFKMYPPLSAILWKIFVQ